MTRKEEIIQAAGKLMGERGFGAVAIADIADACGMSKQALLHHFRNKDAIKDAVVDYLVEHANRSLLALLSTLATDPDARLQQTLGSLDAIVKAEPWAAQVVLRLLLDGDTAAIKRLNAGTLPWARYMSDEITRGSKEGRFRQLDDPQATLEQIGMLILVNFALISQRGWSAESPKKARARKLPELLRILRQLLHP